MGNEKTKPQHTPGPWNVMEGRTLLHVETDASAPVAGIAICSVPVKYSANADLIAAAPDMLREHRRSLSAFYDLDTYLDLAGYKITSFERRRTQDGIRATEAVIAKAEGRS